MHPYCFEVAAVVLLWRVHPLVCAIVFTDEFQVEEIETSKKMIKQERVNMEVGSQINLAV